MATLTRETIVQGNTPERNYTEQTVESQNSIELSLTAKGTYQWSIKVYFQADMWANALARIEDLDTKLRVKYGPKEEK